MINFDESRKKAFEEFSKYNSSKVLSIDEKKIVQLAKFIEVWEVVSEIEIANGSSIDITFFVCLPNDFPLVIPKIYLSQSSYDAIKYIPHLDDNKFICTYDTESIKTDINNPAGIVYACFKKAKKIIEVGLKKQNFSEFDDEFVAYWENNYSEKDVFKVNYLSLLSQEINSKVKLLNLDDTIGLYQYVIIQEDDLSKQFIEWLKSKKINFTEREILYLGNIESITEPPFNFTNKTINDLLIKNGGNSEEGFKTYIKKNPFRPFVVFSKNHNGKKHYYGWEHNTLQTNRKGFRPNFITPHKAFTEFQKNDFSIRISPQDFTPERLQVRSTGNADKQIKKTFFVAGLGSIGSNLLYFLDSLDFPNFNLVDNDLFKTENIVRHFLGIESTGHYKTDELKNHLLGKYPYRNVSSKKISVIKLINETIEELNASDFIFICIGKDNIDNFIGDALKNKTITKPTFFIWVEPFLSGGHCVFINPNKSILYSDYYDKNGYFKFNIINQSEYIANRPELSMKESGCQGSYIPFSNSQIILFLSSLYPFIYQIIQSPDPNTCSFTWCGDKKQLISKNIQFSPFGEKYAEYCLHKNDF